MPRAAGARQAFARWIASSIITLQTLGAERISQRDPIGARDRCRRFAESTISAEQLDVLMTYLSQSGGGRSRQRRSGRRPRQSAAASDRRASPATPDRSDRCCVRRTACRRSVRRGREIVAYDLNEGTIKWRSPLGSVRALAAKGIKNTGNAQRVHRNGPVVTAGGLIFIGTNADGTVRAFDKDTGKILWERELDANPEGIAAVYEVNGRQYVVFCASFYEEVGRREHRHLPGKVEAQGYYVFAVPPKTRTEAGR